MKGRIEIDMVISEGHFLAGDYNFVFDEIAAVKEACGDAHLRGNSGNRWDWALDNVRIASDLTMNAGAVLSKPSTEKFNLQLLFLWLW